MENDTVRMSLRDAEKLGIYWGAICDVTGGNRYAINEGLLNDDDMIDVPVKLIRPQS